MATFAANTARAFHDSLLQTLSSSLEGTLSTAFETFATTLGISKGPESSVLGSVTKSLSGFCVGIQGRCQLRVVLDWLQLWLFHSRK